MIAALLPLNPPSLNEGDYVYVFYEQEKFFEQMFN